jgi:hypothetical protein
VPLQDLASFRPAGVTREVRVAVGAAHAALELAAFLIAAYRLEAGLLIIGSGSLYSIRRHVPGFVEWAKWDRPYVRPRRRTRA